MITRNTAKKLFVSDILGGTYIKRSGWDPSGVLTRYGEISRTNLMGVIVSISQDSNSFLIDDGTGNIQVRSFDSTINNDIILGALVNVIGKPREWGQSKYIVPEIVRKIENLKWYSVHQKEVELLKKRTGIALPVEQNTEQEEVEIGPYQKILNIIAMLDKGSGADVQDITANAKVPGCDAIISALIEEGEIFEISPGRVKLLE
jgi:RPA family protein